MSNPNLKSINIADSFRKVDISVKEKLAHEESKLNLGLSVLTLSQNLFNFEYLSLDQIIEALDCMGIAAERSQVGRAFSRAGNKIRRIKEGRETKYKVMILGQQEVMNLISGSNIELIHIENGKPHTARKKLADIFGTMDGIIRICDPYYGLRSLETISMFPKKCKVHFLTGHTSEKSSKIKIGLSDFKTEYQNVEIRIYPKAFEMHDRYIITSDLILIIGHGLKDIGNKESFIIQIDKSLAFELIENLTALFDKRWQQGTPL